jgi:hypothetical protein
VARGNGTGCATTILTIVLSCRSRLPATLFSALIQASARQSVAR